jgi:hypothetical protein
MSQEDPYNISNIDMSKINERPNRYSDNQVGQAKWLMDAGLPIKRTAELTGIAHTTLSDIRRGKDYPHVKSIFPVDLITVDDLEAVEVKVKILKRIHRLH